VARILIVGGGCRGRALAGRLIQQGHAVRITTRTEAGRAAIEAAGAECWIGTPDRLATLRGSLDGVAIGCWLLAQARGEPRRLAELHSSRLELFLTQAIDTTARGLVYDATPGRVPVEALAEGSRIFAAITERNAIPGLVLGGASADAGDDPDEERLEETWLRQAQDAVAALLGA